MTLATALKRMTRSTNGFTRPQHPKPEQRVVKYKLTGPASSRQTYVIGKMMKEKAGSEVEKSKLDSLDKRVASEIIAALYSGEIDVATELLGTVKVRVSPAVELAGKVLEMLEGFEFKNSVRKKKAKEVVRLCETISHSKT